MIMNVGILGCGRIAAIMAETIKMLDDPSIKLFACAAREPGRARAFARTYGIPRVCESYEALARDPEVSLIYVATPHSHHYAQGMMCLDAGKPVLMEKAFTHNAREASRLLKHARDRGVFLTEAIWTRYMPSRELINDLARGIGPIHSITANLGYPLTHKERIIDPALAGGVLLDLLVYPINFALMVTGDDPVVSLHGQCFKQDFGRGAVDVSENVTLVTAGGVFCSLQALGLTPSDNSGYICGERGFLRVENINNPAWIEVYNAQHELIRKVEVPEQVTGYEYEVIACQRALEAGAKACVEMPHAETVRVMELCDRLREEFGIVFPGELRE